MSTSSATPTAPATAPASMDLPIPKSLPFSIALVVPDHPMLRAHLVRQLVHLNCPPVGTDTRMPSALPSRPWTHAHYEMTELEEAMLTSPRPLWDAVSTPCLVSIEIPDPNVTPMSSVLTTLLLKKLKQMHIASWLSFVFLVDKMDHLPWVLLDNIRYINITGPALEHTLSVTGTRVSDFLATRVGYSLSDTVAQLDVTQAQSLFLCFDNTDPRMRVGGSAVAFDPCFIVSKCGAVEEPHSSSSFSMSPLGGGGISSQCRLM